MLGGNLRGFMKNLYQIRSDFYEYIRLFFKRESFLEVETPLLSPTLIPEVAIEIFRADFIHPWEESLPFYLIPSPEIFMKELLSQGVGSLFQITKSFRNAESTSSRHNPEFTMLEWYSISDDYKDNIQRTQEFIHSLFPVATDESKNYLSQTPKIISMREAFLDFVNIDLEKCYLWEDLRKEATLKGYTDFVSRSHTWEELFNFIFVSHVEPYLPSWDQPVYLIDYPTQIITTAKKKNSFYYERWELYMKGLEIANCFSEEASPEEVKRMFQEEASLKESSLVPHKVDFDYYKNFENSKFPVCSGVAMGLDRLLMVLRGVKTIEEVLPFSFANLKKIAQRVKNNTK